MSGGGFFELPARPELTERKPQAHRLAVSETFFATMGIPVLLGRGFAAADVDGAPRVVVVNEAFVHSYLPSVHPVGQVLRAGKADWQIVGVCRDTKYTSIKTEVPLTVYFSYRQDGTRGAYVALRTTVPPLAVVSAARQAVAAIDPGAPLSDVTTQAAVLDQGISQERMFATLCGALASLALLLTCIGVYGLMSYDVARRTGEIGVRTALGATAGRIALPILRDALMLVGAGTTVGLGLALCITRVVKTQLYGVEAGDPFTFAAAGAAALLIALGAAWLPARRAARVDPMVALRCE
jgi:predicted permease